MGNFSCRIVIRKISFLLTIQFYELLLSSSLLENSKDFEHLYFLLLISTHRIKSQRRSGTGNSWTSLRFPLWKAEWVLPSRDVFKWPWVNWLQFSVCSVLSESLISEVRLAGFRFYPAHTFGKLFKFPMHQFSHL